MKNKFLKTLLRLSIYSRVTRRLLGNLTGTVTYWTKIVTGLKSGKVSDISKSMNLILLGILKRIEAMTIIIYILSYPPTE